MACGASRESQLDFGAGSAARYFFAGSGLASSSLGSPEPASQGLTKGGSHFKTDPLPKPNLFLASDVQFAMQLGL
jgi:hypothetical protein